MIGLAIKFLFGGISKAAQWALSSATHILAVALVIALAWGYWGHRSAAKWERVLKSTEIAYRDAQAKVELAQEALNSSISARYIAIAKESADDYPKAVEHARSAVADYARRMPAQACSATGGTKPAPMLDNPGMDAGPGENDKMAAITIADLDILADNTVRAESCRALGQVWIDGGLAVAGE